MSGIVNRIKEYRNSFGNATAFTHPSRDGGLQTDGVSMLTAPSKSNFNRHGVITSLTISGAEYAPALKVYLPMEGSDAQDAWPLTYMDWDGKAHSGLLRFLWFKIRSTDSRLNPVSIS